MSVSSVADILRNLGRVQALFPDGFNATVEALKAGVSTLELGALGVFSKSPAAYDAEEQAIRLDPGLSDLDREQLAAEVNRRHRGLGVTSEDVLVFVLFHELGHHRRRKNLLAMDRRNSLAGLGLAEGEAVAMEEHEAELYAKRKFLEWKRSRT